VRKIALDIGSARIGVALSQDSLALPHSVIQNGPEAVGRILALLSEYEPVCVYIGLPISLSGSHTQSTKMAIEFARTLASQSQVPLRLIDERLTSKSASQALHQAGKNSRAQKGIIDASAAAMILEFALSAERDGFAGKALEEFDA
jgi:putative holliday junction resolvase